MLRSHATAEVLGRNDDRNPRFYYGTGKVTPKRDFWSTREGKAVKRNWSALQGELIDAFNDKADEFVALVARRARAAQGAQGRRREGGREPAVGRVIAAASLARPLSASSRSASVRLPSPSSPIPASTPGAFVNWISR